MNDNFKKLNCLKSETCREPYLHTCTYALTPDHYEIDIDLDVIGFHLSGNQQFTPDSLTRQSKVCYISLQLCCRATKMSCRATSI